MSFFPRRRGQMSDSMVTALFIILSGGLQDAYTYVCRGKVFANAQTGNIVLLSTNFFEGDWGHALRYLVPLLSFLLGIYIAECVHRRFKHMEKVHWRQLILLAELVLLMVVGFLPQAMNTTANAVVSFVCAMQVQTFRKVRGHAYAGTMCIGNMRSGTEALCARGDAEEKLQVSCAVGQVSLVLRGQREEYAHHLACSLGEIRCGEDGYSGMGRAVCRDGQGGKELRVTCGIGRICIDCAPGR